MTSTSKYSAKLETVNTVRTVKPASSKNVAGDFSIRRILIVAIRKMGAKM